MILARARFETRPRARERERQRASERASEKLADKKRPTRPLPPVNSVIKIISTAIVVEPFLSPRASISRLACSFRSYYMRFSRGGEYFLRFFLFVDLVSVCDFVCFLSDGIIEKVTFTIQRCAGGSVSSEACDF